MGRGFTNEMAHSSLRLVLVRCTVDVLAVYGRLKSVNFGRAGSVGYVFSATSGTTFSTGFGTLIVAGVSIMGVSTGFSV